MVRVFMILAVFSAWAFHVRADEDFYLISRTNINSLKYYRTETKGSYSYKLVRASDEIRKEIIFESNHNYTSGYLSDKLLVLTNNNTEDSPCILIWDFATDQLKEDQILSPERSSDFNLCPQFGRMHGGWRMYRELSHQMAQ